MKNWEVGSTWYITPRDAERSVSAYCHLDTPDGVTFLSTCRSAIALVAKEIGSVGGTALVPGFTCHSVIRPLIDAGYRVSPYAIRPDLTIDIEALISQIERLSPSIILVHGYFGLDTLGEFAKVSNILRDRGIIVVEDMTQTMFSSFPRPNSDYALGSIRKWMPVPDGAFVTNVKADHLEEDTELSCAKTEAMLAKGVYIVNGVGDKQNFMDQATAAERLLDSRNGPFAASTLTMDYLKSLDISMFVETRRENYSRLAERLVRHGEIRIPRPEIKDGEVPFMLPVFINRRRAELQKYMAAHNVYPTIIWKCPDELAGEIDSSTKNIYDSILCFHIDQRYSARDMEAVADIADIFYNTSII